MKYRYVQSREDYTDVASGRIFYATPGHPAFPVRLASDIFQRCLALRRKLGATGCCTLYDPCCGGAYLLGVIAYLNWESIDRIIGSDIDERALSFAWRNLALLTLDGLDQRIAEISEMETAYAKPSHTDALISGQRLRQRLLAQLQVHPIKTMLFRADATDRAAILENLGTARVDILITDTPMGSIPPGSLTMPHRWGRPVQSNPCLKRCIRFYPLRRSWPLSPASRLKLITPAMSR